MNNQSRIEIEKSTFASLVFKIIFFLFSFIEIYSEFTNDITLKWMIKPLLVPILIGLYFITSKKISCLYIIALLFNWIANVLFISTEIKFLLLT